jgi:hypothetical protein
MSDRLHIPLKYQIFNRILFCPRCMINGRPHQEDPFLFFNNITQKYQALKIKEVPNVNQLYNQGFTPHLMLRQAAGHRHVIYKPVCGICEVNLLVKPEGDFRYRILLTEVSDNNMKIERWNRLCENQLSF